MTKNEVIELIEIIEEQQKLIDLLLVTCKAETEMIKLEMIEATKRIALRTQYLKCNIELQIAEKMH